MRPPRPEAHEQQLGPAGPQPSHLQQLAVLPIYIWKAGAPPPQVPLEPSWFCLRVSGTSGFCDTELHRCGLGEAWSHYITINIPAIPGITQPNLLKQTLWDALCSCDRCQTQEEDYLSSKAALVFIRS